MSSCASLLCNSLIEYRQKEKELFYSVVLMSKNPKFSRSEIKVMNEALSLFSSVARKELSESTFLADVPAVMAKARAIDSASEKVGEWLNDLVEEEKEKQKKQSQKQGNKSRPRS